jgi:hypothetical protein
MRRRVGTYADLDVARACLDLVVGDDRIAAVAVPVTLACRRQSGREPAAWLRGGGSAARGLDSGGGQS